MKIMNRPLTDDEVQEVLNIAKKIEEVVDKLGLYMRNYASLPISGYDYEYFTKTNFVS
jgi:predicted transcriptional regulator